MGAVPPEVGAVAQFLSEAGCVAAFEEAEELIEAAAGDPAALEVLLDRRRGGEPLAWLTGSVTFCGVRVLVDSGVYVPRWQTEPLALQAAALLPPKGVAVDLCTGAGAIAAVLMHAEPSALVVATELDAVAARCSRRNGVEVLEGFLDEPLPLELHSRVDVLTAVVPYVPTESIHLLPRDVQKFEPLLALDGGPGGTRFLVEVARRSSTWLRHGGWLLLEMGGDQVVTMGETLEEIGFRETTVITDDDGDPRGLRARLAALPR
jgi:release factor glutamine methyltransferase